MNISIQQHSGVYVLSAEQLLPVTISSAWQFFSSPQNLQAITPANVNFKITSGAEGKIYAGKIITYKIQLIPFIKNNWVTEITSVDEGKLFVDEQLSGPYALWHHEHHFEQVANGVMMKDIVTYKLPMGFLGRMVAGRIVKNILIKIFSFRYNVLSQVFPAANLNQ